MNFRRFATVTAGAFLLALTAGCGGASNDQGVSFTLLGYYQVASTSINDAGLSGIVVPLTTSPGIDQEPTPAGTSLHDDGSITAKIGLVNNLDGIGIRAQRLFLNYFIPGSNVQPPSTSFGISAILAPATNSGTPQNPGSDLPPGFGAGQSSRLLEVPILPHEIREWLAFNRNELPEPPFTIELTSTVTGLTTAGDRLDSNAETLSILISPDNIIPPGSGSGGGASSAGEVSSAEVSSSPFDGSSSQ